MFSGREAKGDKTPSSRMRHLLAAVVEKTGKGSFAKWNDCTGVSLRGTGLDGIKSDRTGLGTAWHRKCDHRDGVQAAPIHYV